jgi:YD repeat-containing protein
MRLTEACRAGTEDGCASAAARRVTRATAVKLVIRDFAGPNCSRGDNAYGQALSATDSLRRVPSYFCSADTTTDDVLGDLQSVTNAVGKTSTLDKYIPHGQLLLSTDPGSVATIDAFDLRWLLLSTSVGGQTTSYAYDSAGQFITVNLSNGAAITQHLRRRAPVRPGQRSREQQRHLPSTSTTLTARCRCASQSRIAVQRGGNAWSGLASNYRTIKEPMPSLCREWLLSLGLALVVSSALFSSPVFAKDEYRKPALTWRLWVDDSADFDSPEAVFRGVERRRQPSL